MPDLVSSSPSSSAWCSFSRIPSAAMASMVAERCLYSLATLEFANVPARSIFALIELEHHGSWRWAIVNSRGLVLDEGREPTEGDAQKVAELALRTIAV